MRYLKNRLHPIITIIFLYICVIPPGLSDIAQAIPPLAELSVTTISNAGAANPGSNVKVSGLEYDLMGNIAKQKVALGNLIIGGHYKYTRYEVDNLNADKELHVLEVPFTLLHRQGEWTYITRLAPGIRSDFKDIEANDVGITGRFVASIRRSEQLAWVMGAALDRSFGDTALYPVIGAQYAPNEKTFFDLVLPRLAIWHAISSKVTLFWNLLPSGDKWNVKVNNINREFNVTTKALRTALGAEFNLSDNGWARIEAGREINRSIELVNSAGTAFDLDFEDTTFATVSFLYRM